MKISQVKKDLIQKKLMSPIVEENERIIDGIKDKFAIKVYESVYPKSETEAVEAIGDKWYSVLRGIQIRDEHGNRGFTITVSKGLLLPRNVTVIRCNKALTKELEAITLHIDNLNQEIIRTRQEVRSRLNAFQTDKSLIDAWPEISDVVKSICDKDAPNPYLPALNNNELNKKLGLK